MCALVTGVQTFALPICLKTTPFRFSRMSTTSSRTPGMVEYSCTTPVICTSVGARSEEHTSELQSLMRNSYAVFCLKKIKSAIQGSNVPNPDEDVPSFVTGTMSNAGHVILAGKFM